MAKRAFDIVVSVLALVFLSPLALLIAILIKLDSRGPVFYVVQRCGRSRRPFNFYKFRTMVSNADRLGSSMLTASKDRRVTRLGKYLRLFKLDELPQFFSVLEGDMSIVGPRPEVFEVIDNYYADKWDEVLTVRPGITCLLQIEVFPDFTVVHKGVEDPERFYVDRQLAHKLQRDLEYVRNSSFALDLKIILQTIYCVAIKSWSYLFSQQDKKTT